MIYQGKTVRLKCLNVEDYNGNPITAPTSISILLVKADGSQTSITTNISNDGSGNYHYDLEIGTSDPAGQWKVFWTVVNGSYTDIEKVTFTVEQMPQQ